MIHDFIETYKQFFWDIRQRPSRLLFVFAVMLFQYVICTFFHWSGCDIPFPEAFFTGLRSAIGFWLMTALIPGIIGMGG